MSGKIYMTEAEVKRHQDKRRREKGEPDFDNESDFQAWAEAFLRRCGFRSRTPANIATHHKKLWYVHLNKTKANPIIGDFVLIDARCGPYKTRMIEPELKNGMTEMTLEQKYLHKRGEIIICRYKAEFKAAVFEFLKGGKDDN